MGLDWGDVDTRTENVSEVISVSFRMLEYASRTNMVKADGAPAVHSVTPAPITVDVVAQAAALLTSTENGLPDTCFPARVTWRYCSPVLEVCRGYIHVPPLLEYGDIGGKILALPARSSSGLPWGDLCVCV
jgi:hypothetical protein